jgi:hypothetical protein
MKSTTVQKSETPAKSRKKKQIPRVDRVRAIANTLHRTARELDVLAQDDWMSLDPLATQDLVWIGAILIELQTVLVCRNMRRLNLEEVGRLTRIRRGLAAIYQDSAAFEAELAPRPLPDAPHAAVLDIATRLQARTERDSGR